MLRLCRRRYLSLKDAGSIGVDGTRVEVLAVFWP